ncbi:membrane protein [Modestobacter caceresii]|uniref:Membrane protein n=1 Tax=Modestobacter caceresii TaxID=1522368 RepID=A0A098YBU1_9ACTN|nr:membrane protein [Modestobacter caceresii]
MAQRWSESCVAGEEGMSTAEYAVGTVAACAFAAVLYQVVTGGSVVAALGELVQTALATLA